MTHSEINSIVQQSACSPLVDWMPRVSGWKDDLAYLTADSETGSHELDPTKVYSVGGLVGRNCCKEYLEYFLLLSDQTVGNKPRVSWGLVL
ncbi:hypothetical protein V6N12_038101 [Hibiscus sabdariffa]|uniref:Uncharacterized protein n=1 Tax=Hibiscus sabdariffa TaxID=183260 RepID=A0ABR2BWN9_9ROSI